MGDGGASPLTANTQTEATLVPISSEKPRRPALPLPSHSLYYSATRREISNGTGEALMSHFDSLYLFRNQQRVRVCVRVLVLGRGGGWAGCLKLCHSSRAQPAAN